jgi:hypothetical protein
VDGAAEGVLDGHDGVVHLPGRDRLQSELELSKLVSQS